MKIPSSIRVPLRSFAGLFQFFRPGHLRCAPVVVLFLFAISPAFSAEPLPLSTSYWKDPAFLKSFNGSYRIEARIEPNVTTEERGLLVEIQNLMAAEKRSTALEKLAASSLTEKSAALTFNLGNLYFETGEMEKAIAAYEAALKQYPSFRRAHQNLALALVREEKLPEALEHLTEAIRLGDSSGSTYGLLGYCRLARQEYASALQAYRLAQVTEPDVPEWSAGIAQCLQNLDQKEEAAALLDEVVRKRPLEPSYSVLLSNILLELNKPSAAAKALELPHRLDLLTPDQILLLADLHLRAGLADPAKQAIEKAFADEEKKPTDDPVLRLITTASSRSEWPLVKDLLEKAKTDKPSRAMRLATARYLIASEEDPAAGTEMLEKLVSEDPTDGTAILALAKQKSEAQPAAAELLFERATADPSTAYEAHVELARHHVSQSRYADALKSIDKALSLSPSESLRSYRAALQQALAATE